jgi:hypothetical protein
MSSLKNILQKLGIDNNDYLFNFSEDKWKIVIPYRLHKGLSEIKPDVFLAQKNKPVILFFDFTNEKKVDTKILFQKIWNLGGVPIVYIIYDTKIEIFNGFSFDCNKKQFSFLKIEEDKSFWDIITSGDLWNKLPRPKNQVDQKLLDNIRAAKEELIKNNLDSICANNIIGRLLFSRYLIDRNVKINSRYFKDKFTFLKIIKNKKLLYEYFNYLKTNFKGDLFPVSDNEEENINDNHLNLLYRLFNGDQISTGQQSLFESYDFKIIPIELISEVYERFIGEEKQKTDGAYYTPSFLVDYILEKTVKEYLLKNKSCKVFDPSCGSGIFLVETLRCIIEKNIKNDSISKENLKKIVKNNIFGVDKNENAVNISIFSLYLTLLDYIEPKNIANFKFPTLKNINLFVADFFDIKNIFNKKINNIDFIIGNPPWGSTKKDYSHVEYSFSNNIPISDNQIAQSFIARIKDFSDKKTKCALIIASKILYNHNASNFRKYLLKNFLIQEVMELSSVRMQLFSKASAPSSIIFYKYSQKENTDKNIVIHTSIKPNIFLDYLKILVIEKSDIKKIEQKYFLNYDWLWKIMLYGNSFDFYFVKKLKEYKNLQYFLKENKIVSGAGFKIANRKYRVEEFKDKYLLEPDKLHSFRLDKIKLIDKYPDLLFENKGVEETYKSPHILLKRSLKDSPILTYSKEELLFPNTIYGIHGENDETLKAIGSYLSSSLVRYLLFLTSTTWGVEREEVLLKEYKNLPFAFNENTRKKLSSIMDDLLIIGKKNKAILDNTNYENIVKLNIQKIDNIMEKNLEIDEIEKSLIDYNTNITIPLFFNNKKPLSACKKEQINNYVQVFINYLDSRYGGNYGFVEVDVYVNHYIIGINFRISKEERKEIINFIEVNGNEKNSIFNLMKLGQEKIADKFYLQRDIRGFNKESFYIIKSNQYKNWHRSVAWADLHEVIKEMITNKGA